MTARVNHASTTGAAANPRVLVDGPKWDADHTVTGVAVLDADNAFTGSQTINPTTGTINKGLAITQTAPSSGTQTGPVLFNTVDVTNPGTGASGTGVWDTFGVKNLIYAYRSTMTVTGASSSAGSSAFGAITNIAAPSDGFGGATGVTVTGTSPDGHYMWGGLSYAIGFVNSKSGALIGLEAEVGLGTGGTTSYRIGVSSNSQGPVKGGTLDAAFSANVIGNVIPGSSGTSAPWDHLMALSGNLYSGGFPISTTGDFFYSDTPGTVAHFANLPNVTVTGNILGFPNAVLTGAGQLTIAGKAGIGNSTVTPDATLMVNSNTGAAVAPILNVDAHLIGADSVDGGILSDVYGGEAFFVGRASGGTRGSKTARAAASPYMALIGRTWDGSAYATGAFLEFSTVNLQSVSDHSAKARLAVVPSGSTTATDVMLWGPGVAIGSGAVDQGAGTLNVATNYYLNGTLLRNATETLTNKNLASGTNTGATAAVDTSNTSLATNAYVINQAASATPLAVTNTAVVGTSTRFARADHVHPFESAAWSTYSPTVTALVSGPPTVTATGRYKQIGKTVHLQFDILITALNSSSSTMIVSLPITGSAFRFVGACKEVARTGIMGSIELGVSATTASVLTTGSGTFFGLANDRVVGSVTYEVP